jgi:hypothetical protein
MSTSSPLSIPGNAYAQTQKMPKSPLATQWDARPVSGSRPTIRPFYNVTDIVNDLVEELAHRL